MKQIYLAGPVSGRPIGEYTNHFDRTAETISERAPKDCPYIGVFNPVRYCAGLREKDAPWHLFMRACLPRLAECDDIGLLQGWEKSRGARLEYFVAGELKIPVVYLEPPVDAFALSLMRSNGHFDELTRYFQTRYSRCIQRGYNGEFSEECAVYETANRYLDPYGFEYLDDPFREENYGQI
jgi:hypothetical protein